MTTRRWNTTTKIIVTSVLAVAGIILLVTFRQMIAPTIVAFLLAFVLGYPVNWLQQRTGWGRGATVFVVYLLVVLGLSLLLWLVMPQLDEIIVSFRRTFEDLAAVLQSGVGGPTLELGPLRLSADELLTQAGGILLGVMSSLTSNPMEIARGLTTSVVNLVYVVVLNYWLLKDSYKLERFLISLIPTEYQEEIRRLAGELAAVWQAFLRGQMLLGVVIGLIVYVCLLILGMPNAGGLALLAGILELLPSVGPAISGSIATVLAFFYGSNWMPVSTLVFAIVISVVYSIIGQIESVYFIPRLVGGRVKLHPGLTFIGIMAGALVFGVLGILLAAPVIASARVLLIYISHKLTDREPFDVDRHAQSALRIPGVVAGRKVEAVVFDLDGTITELDTTAIDWAVQHFDIADRVIAPATRGEITRRTMMNLEAPANAFMNVLWQWEWADMMERIQPGVDRLRAYPPASEMQLRPGMAELVQRISAVYRLGLVTTRNQADVQRFLHANFLDTGIFDAVVAREDVRNTLPHVDPLTRIASLLGVQPSQMLVVSDTDANLRAARAAEMATAGVLNGLSLADAFVDADIVVGSAAQLVDYL